MNTLLDRLNANALAHNRAVGCVLTEIGPFIASTHRTIPVPWYNYAMPFDAAPIPDCQHVLAQLIAHYHAYELTPRVNFITTYAPTDLPEHLVTAGFVRDEYEHVLMQVEAPLAIEIAPALNVRLATPDDDTAYDEVLRIGFGPRPANEPDWRPALNTAARASGVQRLGAWWEGVLAGVASLNINAGLGYITAVATLPAYRGRGIARALTALAAANARAAGAQAVALSVIDSPAENPAQAERVYRRLGFARVAIQVGYVYFRPGWDMPHAAAG